MAGDDGVVVEGVEQGEFFSVAETDGFGVSFVVIIAVKDDVATVTERGGDLHEGRTGGHDDDRADAAARGVIADGLRVVAGTGCDDTAALLVFSEGEDAIEGSAFLEGAGHLEVVELQVKIVAGELREGFGVRAGGEIEGIADPLASLEDVLKTDH